MRKWRSGLKLMKPLLSHTGSIFVQCDWRASAYIRIELDEIYGRDNFRNEIIWAYRTGGVTKKTGFVKKHDTIFWYSNTRDFKFNVLYQKSYTPTLSEPGTPYGKKHGVKRDKVCDLCGKGKPGQKYRMVVMRDVWSDVNTLYRNDSQGTGYPTQKPEKLLHRIISATTDRGDLVADFFCGSGTTLAVCYC